MAKIFITLLTHNNGPFIESSIKSVLNQTFQDWNMLISDDASNDNTYNTIKHLLVDERIQYIYHKDNLKQPKNWEFALKQANAQIIATLHADDEWLPNTLFEVNTIFDKNKNCDLVWGNWEFFNQNFKPLNKLGPVLEKRIFTSSDDAKDYLGRYNQTLPSATFISKRVLDLTGYPNDKYRMLCDREFYFRVLNNIQYCESIPKIICKYRINQDGVSSIFTKNYIFYDEVFDFAMDLENLIYDFSGKNKLIKDMKFELCETLVQGLILAKKNKNQEVSKRINLHIKKINPSFKLSLKNKLKILIA